MPSDIKAYFVPTMLAATFSSAANGQSWVTMYFKGKYCRPQVTYAFHGGLHQADVCGSETWGWASSSPWKSLHPFHLT